MNHLNVLIAQTSRGKVGGGWTFLDNIKKTGEQILTFHYPENVGQARVDIIFIPSCTMTTRKHVRELKNKYPEAGVVLRVDNLPPDHRNSGKGWLRLVDDYEMSDHIIYQSNWAFKHIHPQLEAQKGKKPYSIVYNGVDTEFFNPNAQVKDSVNKIHQYLPLFKDKNVFLFLLSSSDPSKRIEEVVHMYREYWIENKNSLLVLAGQGFSREWVEHNFEFHNDENHLYIPDTLTKAEVKTLICNSDSLIFPAYGNACSNTVLEAMSCGLGVVYQPYGGQSELVGSLGVPIDYINSNSVDMLSRSLDESTRKDIRERTIKHFTLEIMTNGYFQVFKRSIKNVQQ